MSWNTEQFGFVRLWTESLLAFGKQAFTRGTVTDVVAWLGQSTPGYQSFHFAFVGDALKLARAFGFLTDESEGDDINMGASTGAISRALIEHLNARRTAADLRYDRKIQLAEFLERLSGQAIHEFAQDGMPFDEAHGAWILEPGYPWPKDDEEPFSYWSAKAQQIVSPERPGWLIEVDAADQDDAHETLGVNPCAVFPPRPPKKSWPLWARSKGVDILVAHSMTLPYDSPGLHLSTSYRYKEMQLAIEGVRSCGGLLFPSLSFGPIPASNFGPLTLVGHMGLVLDGLSPFKKRGADPYAWVYEHDAWTVSTRELMTNVAVRLFDELHGHEDYVYGYNLWTLGPPAELFGGPSQGSRPIRTVRQLVAAAKRRAGVFSREMTAKQFDDAHRQIDPVDKYVYGEAKARRVISLDEFPYFIGPNHQRDRMERFATGVGYKGQIVTIDDPRGVGDASSNYVMYQWGWLVADAIKKLAPPMEI